MDDDQIVQSLDRHFAVGNSSLTPAQFQAHSEAGICAACDIDVMWASQIGRDALAVPA